MSVEPGTDTTSAEFFEAKYRSADGRDPWGFADDTYERNRYEDLIEALGDHTFDRCLEPGCSIGELSALLAARCQHVVSFDFSPMAIATARERHGVDGPIDFHVAALPEALERFAGPWDLVVLSEVGYYFELPVLTAIAAAIADRLAPSGVVLAGHWTGDSDDHLLAGDEVHDALDDELRRRGLAGDGPRRVRPGFIIDRWSAPPTAPADAPAGR